MKRRDQKGRNVLLKEISGHIEYLKEKGLVDLEEFRGFDKSLEDDETCYSNREVLRGEYESTIDLPYSRVSLYSAPTFGYKDSGIR